MSFDDIEQGEYVICHCFFASGGSSSFLLPTRLISKARPMAEDYASQNLLQEISKMQFIRSNKGWASGLLENGKYYGAKPTSALSELL